VKNEGLDWLADNPLYTKRFAFLVGRRCSETTIRECPASADSGLLPQSGTITCTEDHTMAEPTRSYVSADNKVLTIKRHLLDKVPISQLCDELRISVNTFYNWQKELFENGHLAFAKIDRRVARAEDAQQKTIAGLEAKVQRKDGIIAEIVEENVALKKNLGAS
jgi:transposase